MKNIIRLCLISAITLSLVTVMLLAGCSSKTTTITTTTTAPSTTVTTSAPPAQTLNIGVITDLTMPLSLDVTRSLQSLEPVYNSQGGITIGSQKYKIHFIIYDSKFDVPTAVAAANRLVFQDGVKFIIGDITVDGWMPITEANKVVSVVFNTTLNIFNPKWHYSFQASEITCEPAVGWPWFHEKFPDLKTVGGIWMDNAPGHADIDMLTSYLPSLGMKLESPIFADTTTTDYSSYAIKLKDVNPQVFAVSIGSPMQDALAMKACRDVGYKGTGFIYKELYPGQTEKVTPLSLYEGCWGHLNDYQLEPPQNPASIEAKNAWIAMYGEWDYPSLSLSSPWYVLKAGLEKAGSIDPDKVAEVIGSGLTTDTPVGVMMMISRPDQNNPRTVDSLNSGIYATVKNGKISDETFVSIQQTFDLVNKYGIFGKLK